MKHDEYKNKLSLYVDLMLDEDEERQLIAHIEDCDECKEELKKLYKMKNVLGSMKEEPLPEGFHSDLMNRIQNLAQQDSISEIEQNNKAIDNDSVHTDEIRNIDKVVDISNAKHSNKKTSRNKLYAVVTAAAAVIIIGVTALTNSDLFNANHSNSMTDMAAGQASRDVDNSQITSNNEESAEVPSLTSGAYDAEASTDAAPAEENGLGIASQENSETEKSVTEDKMQAAIDESIAESNSEASIDDSQTDNIKEAATVEDAVYEHEVRLSSEQLSDEEISNLLTKELDSKPIKYTVYDNHITCNGENLEEIIKYLQKNKITVKNASAIQDSNSVVFIIK